MELRVFTEPQQGATYDDLVTVAKEAEALGFGAFFRSDHYLGMGTEGLPGPSDAWITLAGIARETSTIRLGTLMTSATFRLPGPLAISVANVDQMSGGRVELGLGAGWFTQEHSAYGIPFPDAGERFDRLEEQLAIVTGLWSTPPGKRFTHEGAHYTVTDSPALPKPTQERIPVLVGGHGKRRTPELAARFADEFNMPFSSVEDTRVQFARSARPASGAVVSRARWPGPTRWSSASARTRRRSDAGRRRSAGRRTSCARTASPARPRRPSRRSGGTATSGPSGSTSRSSTSPTSTTSGSSPVT